MAANGAPGMIGPNCLGWIRPSARLNLSFAPGMPRVGAVGFFSHSGALCTAILDWSREYALGSSLFASLGNQADVAERALLGALADDPETRVILGYLEGVAAAASVALGCGGYSSHLAGTPTSFGAAALVLAAGVAMYATRH